MSEKLPMQAWVVATAKTGKLVVCDARLPLFWRRHVARRWADDHGIKAARIIKVVVTAAHHE
jgi:predicted kinase